MRASCDTAAADHNRADAELGRWGAGGTGALEAERELKPVPAAAVLASSAGQDEAEQAAVTAAASAALGTSPRISEAPKVTDPENHAEAADA